MSCNIQNAKGGIFLVDKPKGLTSHDVVDFIRRKFEFRKVGHTGTLDPMATGLLIILLGSFTKKSASFSAYDKEYEATLSLGISTDTHDGEGAILAKKELGAYSENIKNIEEIFDSFRGRIEQIPPMYSAKKVKGKKLYELARKGVVLKRSPQPVHIKEIKILKIALPRVIFHVKCSKGTYIRQLAHDIGNKIGCGAFLESLKRTKIGLFELKEAIALDSLSYENILQSE